MLDTLYIIISVAAVLALAYFGTHLLIRVTAHRTGGSKTIRVLDSCLLFKSGYLFLVEVGEELLLLGASEQSISLISRLDREKLPPFDLKDRPANFAGVLTRHFGKSDGGEEQ